MTSADSSLLFRARTLFLTGKGGTGKTALSAAVGRLAAAQGRKTLVVEVDNQRPSLTSIFGVTPSYAPVEVSKNLSICNVEWTAAMDDWLADMVSIPRLVMMITHNRVVSVFLQATPGARDLVVLWRIFQLSRNYETVIVDLPASGNAVAMMQVPNTARTLFDSGPIRGCAEQLLDFFRQPGVGLVQVCLPEEMVITETVETFRKIRGELPMLKIPAVVLNRTTPPSIQPAERALLEKLRAGATDTLAVELTEAGLWDAELEVATLNARQRLAAEMGLPVISLPVHSRGEGSARVVGQLASALARASQSPVTWREG